ncbi:MAG: tetratricopeptide repeat protein [Phycisphaerales bacterium]|jgi:tetratricopeptide (TPR) repeat protein
MKSDHRHELKSNELAAWLADFPEWARQNQKNIMAVAAILVVAILVYFWSFYRNRVVATRNQERLTLLVSQVPQRINEAARAAAQNGDQSMALGSLAEDLKEFAGDISNSNMAALALIKRGEAIRAEQHLRTTDADRNTFVAQIAKAQESYQQALDRKPSNPALAAAAQFGLGLCEEELGNFDKAAEIYRATSQKPEFTGTVAQAAAEYRLKIMGDFKSPVVFKPAPPEPKVTVTPQPQPQAQAPTVQVKPGDANTPSIVPAPGSVPAPAPATPAAPAEANKPAGG